MPKTISTNQLAELLREDPSLNLIDVRTPLEHSEVNLPEADLHPLDQFDPRRVSEGVNNDEPIYVLCRSGNRACKAIEELEAHGFENAVLVEGGIQAWEAENLPVVRGGKVVSLERQVRIAAGALVVLGAVLGFATGSAYWHGLSAFVGAGLMFAGITDTCAMGMLMAKMPWNRRVAKAGSVSTANEQNVATSAAS